MKKQILNEEFLKMQKLAGLITESQYKTKLNEGKTAETLYQMFKYEDLLDDRREYDVEDLMSAYPGLSQEEAKKLFQMLQGNLNENITELKIEWTPEYYEATEKYGDEAYDEKGLANGFKMKDGKKVKEIVGYYVPEDAENENDEEFDIIGYIYSTSEKDIESYSEDDLDDAFMDALSKN